MQSNIFIFALIMLVASCTPTQQTDGNSDQNQKGDDDQEKITAIEIMPNTWVGKTYKVAKAEEEGKLITYSEKQPTLSFQEEKANIKLSVNGCFGSYEASEYTIKINNEGCTEKCCDTQDDQFLLKLLRANTFNFGQFGD